MSFDDWSRPVHLTTSFIMENQLFDDRPLTEINHFYGRPHSKVNQLYSDQSQAKINQLYDDQSQAKINQLYDDRSQAKINQLYDDRPQAMINQLYDDRSQTVVNQLYGDRPQTESNQLYENRPNPEFEHENTRGDEIELDSSWNNQQAGKKSLYSR